MVKTTLQMSYICVNHTSVAHSIKDSIRKTRVLK